jgi:hypothetical protein
VPRREPAQGAVDEDGEQEREQDRAEREVVADDERVVQDVVVVVRDRADDDRAEQPEQDRPGGDGRPAGSGVDVGSDDGRRNREPGGGWGERDAGRRGCHRHRAVTRRRSRTRFAAMRRDHVPALTVAAAAAPPASSDAERRRPNRERDAHAAVRR